MQDRPTINHHIKEDQLQNVYLLATTVYPADIVLPLPLLTTWYKRNKHLWWLATVEDEAVGYLCVLPLTEEAFQKTLLEDFNEDLSCQDICEEGSPFLYYCSVVVSPEWRGKTYSVYHHLTQAFLQSNYQDIQISGMAVSDVGSHVLQALDMEQVLCGQHGKLFAAKLSTQKVADLLLKFQQKISN